MRRLCKEGGRGGGGEGRRFEEDFPGFWFGDLLSRDVLLGLLSLLAVCGNRGDT